MPGVQHFAGLPGRGGRIPGVERQGMQPGKGIEHTGQRHQSRIHGQMRFPALRQRQQETARLHEVPQTGGLDDKKSGHGHSFTVTHNRTDSVPA